MNIPASSGASTATDVDGFLVAARRHSVVPVVRELLADHVTPVAVFLRLCGDEPAFLLESVDHGGRWSRWSFVGRSARARLISKNGIVSAEGEMFDSLDTSSGILDAISRILSTCTSEQNPDLPPLHSGLVGYLGYDVVREVENLGNPPTDDQGLPDAIMSVIGELAAIDHWNQRVTLISNVIVPPDATDGELRRLHAEAVTRLDQMAIDGATPVPEPLFEPPSRDDELPTVRSSMSQGDYERAVEIAKEHVFAGDVFQVVLSQRFDFELDAEPFDVYRVLRQINPSPYMFFIREPEVTLVGCSPEPMVQLLDGRVISRPIAGTRFRGSTDEHDRRLAAELAEHPKERAEHIMLVDLARNDVGRVVDFGTCQVDELMELERFSHVMHLTSQVSGVLAEGRNQTDVLAATLPAGTVSGAPKVRAMQIIDDLEPTRRGPYAGVAGYIDFSGEIDTAIAIRTMVIRNPLVPGGPRNASVQAGAGIVADSDPVDEELETRNKAKALLAAVRPAERMMDQRRDTER